MTNQYDNGGQDNINPNVHVDHHNLGTIKDSEADSTFRIYLATDGGVYYTKSGKDPGARDDEFKRAGVVSDDKWLPAGGYNTTQFYGADKVTGKEQYIAGAQDNGTFITVSGENASKTTNYAHVIGGDGFEVIAIITIQEKCLVDHKVIILLDRKRVPLRYAGNQYRKWTFMRVSVSRPRRILCSV